MTKAEFVNLFEGTSVKAEGIWEAQKLSKSAMDDLVSYLRPGLTREEIHDHTADFMTAGGSEYWWIHNDPALVLFGEHTTYSGRDDPAILYVGKTVAPCDLVTVDVAPAIRGGWGDITRSFFLKDGKVIPVEETDDPLWIEGMKLEKYLHEQLQLFFNEKTTFSDIHRFTENILKEHGYHNCDYHGNFGHSIENDQSERVTIIPEEHRVISDYNKPFTYEPHICKDGTSWGIKHEDMYVFFQGKLERICPEE